jgi:hypothetical protein
MTEDKLNSFRKPNQGDAEETKEENKKENKEWNCNEFQGFHDSSAFKGNCFLPIGRQRSRILFCRVEPRRICIEANSHERRLFFGIGDWLFEMTGMVTTP